MGAGLNGWCDNGSLSQPLVQVAVEHERLGVNEPWHWRAWHKWGDSDDHGVGLKQKRACGGCCGPGRVVMRGGTTGHGDRRGALKKRACCRQELLLAI